MMDIKGEWAVSSHQLHLEWRGLDGQEASERTE